MNNTTFCLNKNSIAICPPGAGISDIMLSADFKASIILLSGKYLDENSPDNRMGITGYLDLLKNPVLNLDDEAVKSCIVYYDLMKERLSRPSHKYINDLMRCLVQAFIYDIWDLYYKTAGTGELTIQGTTLFERFLFLAENNCIREREVRYYSSQLCITPKYLSVVCKKVSDKNASE